MVKIEGSTTPSRSSELEGRRQKQQGSSHFSVHVELRDLPGAVCSGPHLFSGLLVGGDEVDLDGGVGD